MTKWDLVRCADNHFHRVVYRVGPYIANYPEQVLIAGIVNGWCPVYVNILLMPTARLQKCRCDAHTTDLDNPSAEPQTPEKTETLFQTKSSDEVWFQQSH